jgi:uncharacterized membrane protein
MIDAAVLTSMRSNRPVPTHVNVNIENIAGLQHDLERRVSRQHRAVETATGVIGRPSTLFVLTAVISAWIFYNLAAPLERWPELDHAPFFWLQGAIALYAAVVSTMVLTVQIRQSREADRRAHLELQVNLLSEQKAGKIIALLEELRRDLPNVTNREDLLAEAMQKQMDPRAVLAAMEAIAPSQPPPPPPGVSDVNK